MPDCATRVSSGQHGHDGGDPQVNQLVRVGEVIGREINRETGLDGRGDEATVLHNDSIVAEDGLVGESYRIFAGVGIDELFEELPSTLGPYPGKSPAWA